MLVIPTMDGDGSLLTPHLDRVRGAGILRSGAVRLELPATVPGRDVECHDAVGLGVMERA